MKTGSPSRMCFGLTLFNRAAYLPEALESLLGQTHEDFRIVAVDDFSSDDTEEIMRHYVEKDRRITYYRNPSWAGMIATWRSAFYKAFELHKPEYFAWASDHDRYHPEWLERHIAGLDANPESVMAYPAVEPIGPSGEIIDIDIPEPLDTHNVDFGEHLARTCMRQRGAGYAVYGLFRSLPLLRAGVFRRVILPDRLLMTEIAAYGKFLYLSEKLWFRRFFGAVPSFDHTLSAQRRSLFGPESAPPHTHSPYLSHVISLLMKLSQFPAVKSIQPLYRSLTLAGLVWERRQDAIEAEIKNLGEFFKTVPTPGSPAFDKTEDENHAVTQPKPEESLNLMSLGLRLSVLETNKESSWINAAVLAFLMIRDQTRNELKAVEATIGTLQKKINHKELIYESLKQRLEEKEKEQDRLKQRLSKETSVISIRLREKESECVNLTQDIETLRAATKRLGEKLIQDKKTKTELKSSLSKATQRIENLNNDLVVANDGLDAYRKSVKTLEDENSRLLSEVEFWKAEATRGMAATLGRGLKGLFKKERLIK